MSAARPSRSTAALTRLPPFARRMLWFVVAVVLLMAVAALSPSEEGSMKVNPFPGAAWAADVPQRDGCRHFTERRLRDGDVFVVGRFQACE
jgi:hypothetical protein